MRRRCTTKPIVLLVHFGRLHYKDIVEVDKNHEVFSAEPAIIIGKPPLDVEMFIAMDPPKHDTRRKAVQSVVAPKNLKRDGISDSHPQEVLQFAGQHTF